MKITQLVMLISALAYSSFSWCGDDTVINEHMETNREKGAGPGIIISRAAEQGDKPAVAVLYTYQIGESRDRSGAQYVTVLDSGLAAKGTSHRMRVGLSGVQTFNEVSIENRIITLRGKRWAKNDPACCPSEDAILQLSYSSDGFVPLSVSPNTTMQPIRATSSRLTEPSR